MAKKKKQQRSFNQILIIAVIIIFIIVLITRTTPNNSKIVGKWAAENYDENLKQQNKITLEFNKDGTFVMSIDTTGFLGKYPEAVHMIGTYEVLENNQISLRVENRVLLMDYTFSNDELVVQLYFDNKDMAVKLKRVG